ncbi:PREDICTED: uncharacterized protein LOC105368399 [Ceratosolen solmsi marchali]|uniref:Uncharacterized protein LOC105368399 n=1 Tax=Ceratosolen solmsi marchali TaxID=326594 RepID=A0AAJ6YWP7_9HYME|nr:PREDICTED: uncharacterized protein LOC105368399 [Ceratosolen solmsi marchali]
MLVTVTLLFFACESVILSSCYPLDTEDIQNVQQAVAVPLHLVLEDVPNEPENLAGRLGHAYVTTYDQKKASIGNTLNSFQDLGKKTVESGVNLMKNGLEFIFLVPTFGRNALGRQQKTYSLSV